jgi:putative CocE/NonD family hydrolase
VPRLALLAVLLLAALLAAAPAHAEPAPSEGRAWAPRAMGPELYDISAPTPTNGQSTTIEAVDGVDLYIEWWLPRAKDGGPEPPERLPVIAMLSPYQTQGNPREVDTMHNVVSRGYAYAAFHIRGTGLSGGCQEQFSSNEVDDASRAIEWLGRDAPFSNGRVGASGLSYPGITQVAVAGRGDRERVKYLKAIIAGGVATSQYDYNFFDGVPFAGQALAHTASYNGLNSLPSPGTQRHPVERLGCLPEVALGSADFSGNMTPFWKDRDMRPGAERTTAATLIYHGHRDEIDRELALAGYFDRLPATTPKHAIIGTWGHAYPDDVRGQTPWGREDWEAMKLEWFDRYVKGDETARPEDWPTVQVQDSEGQWRAEPDWPRASGPDAALALSAGGALGAARPTGESAFVEGASTEGPAGKAHRGAEQGRLVFTTPPLEGPLHVTGQPVLDTWLQLDRPDAHIAARIEALDESGARTAYGEAMGFRSMQHLDPLVDGRFVQDRERPAPVLTPIHTQIRFDPASIVVPEGGRLRLTIAGSLAPNTLTPSQPSGLATRVTIFHDCTRPTTLRFQTLAPVPDLLNVHEVDEDLPLTDEPATPRPSDGAGLASQPICAG